MEFNYGGLKCLLKGLQMGAEWCLENADTFKVSQQKNEMSCFAVNELL